MDFNIMCYKCNNYGHTIHFCRSSFVESPTQNNDNLGKQKEEFAKVWRRKQERGKEKKEKSMLVETTFHAQNEGNQWYIVLALTNWAHLQCIVTMRS